MLALLATLVVLAFVWWRIIGGAESWQDLVTPAGIQDCPDCKAYVVMKAETGYAQQRLLDDVASTVRWELRQEGVRVRTDLKGEAVTLKLIAPDSVETTALARRVLQRTASGLVVSETRQGLEARFFGSELMQARDDAIARSIQLIELRFREAIPTSSSAVTVSRFDESCVVLLFRTPGDLDSYKRSMRWHSGIPKVSFHLVIEGVDLDTESPSPGVDFLWSYDSGAGQMQERFAVSRRSRIDGARVAESDVAVDESGAAIISVRLDPIGTKQFERMTWENLGRRIAVVVDDKVVAVTDIHAPIESGQMVISGDYSVSEAQALAAVLLGPLPLHFEPFAQGALEDGRVPAELAADCRFRSDAAVEARGPGRLKLDSDAKSRV